MMIKIPADRFNMRSRRLPAAGIALLDPGTADHQINDFNGASGPGCETPFTTAVSAERRAPTPRSIHQRYRTSALNGAFPLPG